MKTMCITDVSTFLYPKFICSDFNMLHFILDYFNHFKFQILLLS